MKRDIPWPGNQINDINQFREACYKKCHLENPTDSGWYEKTDECGQRCKEQLKEYEYLQGKNPCELKLQAPVFWFENYKPFHHQESSSTTITNIDILYIVLHCIIIFLIFVFIVVYVLYVRH